MIQQAVNGKVIRVDMVRPPPIPQRTASELRLAILGEELNQVEQAIDRGDLEGAWDMFKAAAKKVVNGGKDMINKAKEKIKGHSQAPHHEELAPHEGPHATHHEEPSPEFIAEMEKFYKLFDVFFKATESWEKHTAPPTPPPPTSSDLMYYMIMKSRE
jgi:hypothetical protein